MKTDSSKLENRITKARRKLLPERFWNRIRKTKTCWFWEGAIVGGYGRLMLDWVMFSAHRLMYVLTVGPIPKDMVVHHKCRNKHCVNPRHLKLMTKAKHGALHATENGRAEQQLAKTHCPYGHPYTDGNMYFVKTTTGMNGRACKTCAIARTNERRQGLPVGALRKVAA